MTPAKRQRLKKLGFKAGTVQEFLGLSHAEMASIDRNVFLAMGLPDAKNLLMKARLTCIIQRQIKALKMTNKSIASVLQIHQATASKLVNARHCKLSTDRLFRIIFQLDRLIEGKGLPIGNRQPNDCGRKAIERRAGLS